MHNDTKSTSFRCTFNMLVFFNRKRFFPNGLRYSNSRDEFHSLPCWGRNHPGFFEWLVLETPEIYFNICGLIRFSLDSSVEKTFFSTAGRFFEPSAERLFVLEMFENTLKPVIFDFIFFILFVFRAPASVFSDFVLVVI